MRASVYFLLQCSIALAILPMAGLAADTDRQLVLNSCCYVLPLGDGDPPANGCLRFQLAAAAIRTDDRQPKRMDMGCGFEVCHEVNGKVTIHCLAPKDIKRLAVLGRMPGNGQIVICDGVVLTKRGEQWSLDYVVDRAPRSRLLGEGEARELVSRLRQGCIEVLALSEAWSTLARMWLAKQLPDN